MAVLPLGGWGARRVTGGDLAAGQHRRTHGHRAVGYLAVLDLERHGLDRVDRDPRSHLRQAGRPVVPGLGQDWIDPPWSFQAYYRITGNRIGHCFTTGWGFGVFSFGQDIRIDGATGNPSATSWGNGRYDVFAPAGTTVAHQWYTRDVGWSPATGYEHLGQ